MTLQSSGPISLNDIATEFGMPPNSAFPSAFYGKGGAPGSGALGFADFYGRSSAAAVIVTISPASTSTSSGSQLTSSGNHTATVSSGSPTSFSWGVNQNNTGQAQVVSGGSTATANLRGGEGTDVFFCDVVVGGTTYTGFCSRTHDFIG